MRAIGIDIADEYVDMVELRQRFGTCALLSYGTHPLPEGAVVHGIVRDSAVVASAIQACLKEAKPKSVTVTNACFSVPESAVFTHTFTFPRSLSPKEVDEAIRVQFEEYFPFGIEAMCYDWYVTQKSEQTQSIFVGACKKTAVDQILATAKLCGITVDSIDSESMTSARAILPTPKKTDAYLLIDSGASITSLTIFDEYGIQMTMALKSGGNMLSEQIAKKRGVSFAEANSVKKQMNLANEQYADMLHIVEDVYQSVCVEAKRMMLYIETSSTKKVQAVYICGGSSRIKGLDRYIAEQVERKVLRGDALQHLKHRDILGNSEDALQYANAIGLTLAVVDPKKRLAFNFLRPAL